MRVGTCNIFLKQLVWFFFIILNVKQSSCFILFYLASSFMLVLDTTSGLFSKLNCANRSNYNYFLTYFILSSISLLNLRYYLTFKNGFRFFFLLFLSVLSELYLSWCTTFYPTSTFSFTLSLFYTCFLYLSLGLFLCCMKTSGRPLLTFIIFGSI